MSVYLSNELPQLEKRADVKFNVSAVSDFGLHGWSAPRCSSATPSPSRTRKPCKKLLRATAKGYQDAMANPKEAAKAMAKYMKVPEDAEVLERQVEATVVSTNAPRGQADRLAGSADWEADLKLLKETGGIAELGRSSAYYTNAYPAIGAQGRRLG